MSTPLAPSSDSGQISLLKDIAEALNGTYDITSAMAAILPRLSGVLGLRTAWAFRYDAKKASYVEVGASGLPPALDRNGAEPLKCSWCECQERFVKGRLNTAVNIVRCSRLRDAVGEKDGLIFHASIPLRAKDQPLGILNVAAAGESVFTQDALELLRAVGYQVAVAIDRSRMLFESRHYASQLQSLAHLAADLATIADPDRVLVTAAQRFVHSLDFEACGIVRRSPLGPWEVIASATNRTREKDRSYRYREDPQILPEDECLLLTETRSVIMQPVLHTEYWVRLESALAGEFAPTDSHLVAAFCGHIAAALENARLYAQGLRDAKWSERRMLAADLHDSVSQRLFSAQLLISVMALKIADQDTAGILSQVQQLVQTSRQELRDMVQALRPPDSRGLAQRIRDQLEPLATALGIRIDCQIAWDIDRWLTPEQDDALCSIVDEAMQNILKHACAHTVTILVAHCQNRVTAALTDDGAGFDASAAAKGLGLHSMQHRVRALGGAFAIDTAPGRGTRLTLSLPAGKEHS